MNKAQRIARARKAGATTSPAKAAAARLNGSKGGRTRNAEISAYMAQNNCSRRTAYRRLRDSSM